MEIEPPKVVYLRTMMPSLSLRLLINESKMILAFDLSSADTTAGGIVLC